MPISGKQLVKELKKRGWKLVRIKGSHHNMEKDGELIPVPVHGNDTLGKGVVNSIIKQANLDKDEVLRKDQKRK